MAFDLSTAKPVTSEFDLSTARPVATGISYDIVNGKEVPVGSPEDRAAMSPVSGNSGLYNTLLGWQRGVHEIGRGIGQDLGIYSRQDISDQRALDAPLMATTGGKVGNVLGQLNALAPAAFIPGANSFMGAAGLGALTGLAQPSTSTTETWKNIGFGGAGGAGGVAAGRAIGMGYQGIKGLIEPFTSAGQTRIAARTLRSFAGTPADASAAATALSRPQSVLPGIQPTTAELANNPGVNQLQRTLANNSEFGTALANREMSNKGAIVSALDNLAGTKADADVAQHTRSLLTNPLYDHATNITVPADATLGKLLARPSMQTAWNRAQSLASEKGIQLAQPNANDISGQTLQYLKMSLNDMSDVAKQKGIGAHEQRAFNDTLSAFNNWTMKNVPQLRVADRAYSELSAPLNQMDVGKKLRDTLIPAINDFGVDSGGMNAASYANAVRGGDQLAQNVTGMPSSTLQNTLRPDQLRVVNQIGEHLGRRAAAANVGRAIGSNTGQNLAAQNFLRQILGPSGLPQGWAERIASGAMGQQFAKPFNLLAGGSQPSITRVLEDAALHPQQAAGLLRMTAKPSRAARAFVRGQGLLGTLPQPLLYSKSQ